MANSPAPRRLTSREVADLTEEIVITSSFNDFVLAALVAIANEFTAAFNDSRRVETLATAIRDRSFILTPHSGAACDAYATETRAVIETALTSEGGALMAAKPTNGAPTRSDNGQRGRYRTSQRTNSVAGSAR